MKKITALLMAVITAVGILPALPVYGAAQAPYQVKQAPVSQIQIESTDSGVNRDATLYNYNMVWWQPGWATQSQDVAAIPINELSANEWVTYAQRYEIYYRNATPGLMHSQSGFSGSLMDRVDGVGQGDTLLNRPYTKTLAPNSLYEYRIVPYHDNIYAVPLNDGTGAYTKEYRNAPVDAGGHVPGEKRAIFLTDIEVTAAGEGNELTVTWGNPSWGGTNVFDAYEISYQVNDGTNQFIGAQNARVISMADITLTSNGKLQYTITDNRLQTGYMYDVKVEPMKDNRRVRPAPGTSAANANTLFIGNMEYFIAYRDPRNYEYRTKSPALISPGLTITPQGNDYVRLSWDSLALIPNASQITRVEIEELDPDTLGRSSVVGTITGNSALSINYWLVQKPEAKVAYRLAIYTKDPISNTEDTKYTRVVYYDPAYNDFSPYKPEVLAVVPDGQARLLQIDWLAFVREAYTKEEDDLRDSAYDNKYVDKDITYDIYVTDNWNYLNEVNMPVLSISARRLNLQSWPSATAVTRYPSYRTPTPITQFYAKDPYTGEAIATNLANNKVYYIKIVAKRDPSGQLSQPAYGSVYLPPSGPVDMDPQMIAAPPLRVKDVDETSITVNWETKYIELYRPEDDAWYAVLGVDKDGTLVYGKSAMDIEDSQRSFILNEPFDDLYALDLKNPQKVYDYLDAAKKKIADKITRIDARAALDPNAMALRIIDLSTASYEIYTVDYEYMMEQGGYEKFLRTNLLDSVIWVPAPKVTDVANNTKECTITSSNAPTSGPLSSNSAYVVYLRPYITGSDGKRIAYYPNYVMGTTLDKRPELDIDPTTPKLYDDSATDMTLTVYWPQLDNRLEYDIAYSERLANYPDGGTMVEWKVIKDAATVKTGTDGNPYMYFTITNLFPDTVYYIWIRARANNSTGPVNSKWSNPIDMKTKDIIAPLPPQGLGPAGNDHVFAYNRQNGTDYAPTEENALIVEWMRDGNDDNTLATSGEATGGTAEAISLTELISMYMVRFDELIANRSYYLRAKTVLTVTKSGETIAKTYNYIIQLSLEEDFKDYIQFVIPSMEATDSLDPVYTKRKESVWTTTIRLVTARTTGEYDGDVNPDQYPLPTQDWEITYDSYTGTLTYRFRSDKIDAAGDKDQLVDQRFISRLIAERTYVYKIDLTSYGSRTVNYRVVEMPYSILKAFDERKITLEVTAANLVLSFSPGSFNTAAVRALPEMGAGASVKLTAAANIANLPALTAGESYISAPQKISAQVVTPTRGVTVDTFAKPVAIKMAVNSRVVPMDKSMGLYLSTPDTGGWSLYNSQYSDASATLNASTYRVGTFAGIARNMPSSAYMNDATRDAMVRVTSKVNITDMNAYNPNSMVSAGQFNNIVAALANNRASVAMNTPLAAADSQSLARAGLLVTGNVTREAAIGSLVTLYELKAKQVVQPSATVDNTGLTDMAAAGEAYRRNLLKAEDIGFISGTANPKAMLTMGELMRMLDIIIQDAS